MDFQTASAVESVAWQLRLADWPRAQNRAAMNALANGAPPYTEQEVEQNRIVTNVNFLEYTKTLHDARRQLYTAFSSGNDLFTVDVDYGPSWKRREMASKITRKINTLIKKSRQYLDTRDSKFAQMVLHGIGPSHWDNQDKWCPEGVGIEDVLVPSNTLTSLKNLPFFVIYRQYTGFELYQMTHGAKRDPAWNMDMVDRAISWIDEQARQLNGTTWPETWSPEKMEERIKQDGGLYASDAVPTVDVLDLYFWSDQGKQSGWRRRMVLDAWGSPGVGGVGGIQVSSMKDAVLPEKNFLGTRNEFLYNPGNRKFATNIDEIIHFQFADCSCVAPFRYHSVRSLGFLLYAVCHLQNRLRCKFNDSTFESLLQYFRVSNPGDSERLTKVDLIHMGIIPEGLNFIPANERWSVPAELAESMMQINRQTISDNAGSYTTDFDFSKENSEETATRTMAKVNSSAALIGSMLQKAYNQQGFEYVEICRRFCNKSSRDADVRKFWAECLTDGIPEAALNVDRWNVQPVRVIGSGNKMLQVAMADKLVAMRPSLDPTAQKTVDRIYILANSDDPALAEQLVPDKQPLSDSTHDAEVSVASMLDGQPITPSEGVNHQDYAEAWLRALAIQIKGVQSTGGKATMKEVLGMKNLIAHIGQQVQFLAQDKREKPLVKKLSDVLAQLTNLWKEIAHNTQAAMQQQQGQAQIDPKDAAKIAATKATADAKIQLGAQSHAQKTAQREIQFQQQIKQDAIKYKVDVAKTDMETAANIRRGRVQALNGKDAE